MRCLSCNKILSSFESTRKYKDTQRYIDLCNLCYSLSGLNLSDVDEREDLRDIVDEIESEVDDYDDPL